MRLPAFLCARIHCPAHWAGSTQQNIKTETTYRPAFWCSKCHTFRYLFYKRCSICAKFIKAKIFAAHVRECLPVDSIETE